MTTAKVGSDKATASIDDAKGGGASQQLRGMDSKNVDQHTAFMKNDGPLFGSQQ